ncbi:MAG: AraC family transcriptional regulator [Clostridiaceae bacterium]|nr:AraC family transcriptional regulator [Clostridiaceae bacterium]
MNAFYQSPLDGPHPYLVSIGSNRFNAHWHSELETLYVLSGALEVQTDETVYTVTPGKAVFVGAAVPHAIEIASPGTRYLVLELGAALLGDGYFSFWERRLAAPFVDFGESSPSALGETMDEIAAWIQQRRDSPACEWQLLSLLYRFAALVAALPYTTETTDARARRLLSLRRMQGVLSYVAERYAESLTVQSAAAISGYEEKSFCRSFKAVTGRTFHRYLNETRVDAAKRLLSQDAVFDENRSIAEIGEAVGFPEPKTFSRVFHAITGETPAAYRAASFKSLKS